MGAALSHLLQELRSNLVLSDCISAETLVQDAELMALFNLVDAACAAVASKPWEFGVSLVVLLKISVSAASNIDMDHDADSIAMTLAISESTISNLDRFSCMVAKQQPQAIFATCASDVSACDSNPCAAVASSADEDPTCVPNETLSPKPRNPPVTYGSVNNLGTCANIANFEAATHCIDDLFVTDPSHAHADEPDIAIHRASDREEIVEHTAPRHTGLRRRCCPFWKRSLREQLPKP